MKNINSHSETLFSIAGVEDTFSGRYRLREMINNILPTTLTIFAEAKRPHFYPSSITTLIDGVAEQIENLNLDKELFSVSFDYTTRENDDELVHLLEELWFLFEQPCFVLFQDDRRGMTEIESTMTWTDITDIASCYVIFKSVEDTVMWVGKSKGLHPNPGLILDEKR